MADSDSITSNKRSRLVFDSDESPEAKRIRENLLDILEDEDASADRDPALASVMKIFEEEIGLSSPDSAPVQSLSQTSESLPDLGFLLEASDDELGLPPTSSGEENDKEVVDILRVTSEAVGFDRMWGFEDEIPCYDALTEFGIRFEEEPVVIGGLFDFTDAVSGPVSDFSELLWRPESLPAL